MSDTVTPGPALMRDITCPACSGEGTRMVDTGSALTEYTCETCRGTGLVHPRVAERIRQRMTKSRHA